MVSIILVWGAAYPMVKLLLLELGPMELAVTRFWIIFPPLLAIAIYHKQAVVGLIRRHPLRVLLLGLLGVPGYHLTFNLGTRLLSEDPATAGSAAMLTSVLVSSVPAWTALIAHVVRMEFLSRRQWLGQGLALAGVVFIATRGDFTVLHFSSGALWTSSTSSSNDSPPRARPTRSSAWRIRSN